MAWDEQDRTGQERTGFFKQEREREEDQISANYTAQDVPVMLPASLPPIPRDSMGHGGRSRLGLLDICVNS